MSGTCDVIGENIEVQEFLFEDGVCKKWKVTYTYINWCTGEQKGPYTRYYKYKDEEKPVLTCQDQMFAANPNPQNPNGGCEGTVNLEASATDGGGCTDNGWLKWTVFVDLWGNGTTDYEFSSFLPTTDNNLGNDTNNNGIPDRYVAPTSSGQTVKVPAFVLAAEMSTHKVSWKVTDGCGNVTGCESTFYGSRQESTNTILCELEFSSNGERTGRIVGNRLQQRLFRQLYTTKCIVIHL